jgi:transposase-like protein
MVDYDDDDQEEPDFGRLVADHWPELRDPREDIYTEEDGLSIVDRGNSSPPRPLPKTMLEAVEYFSNLDDCRRYLAARRWPNGIRCPVCGSISLYVDSSRNGWECKTRHPRRKFSLKTGTIFQDSPLGFDKWLPAVWMIANIGMSCRELQSTIGVSYVTAWFMILRIRLAMQTKAIGQ